MSNTTMTTSPATIVDSFVRDMRDAYVEQYRTFLREAAEEAIEESVNRLRKRLAVQGYSEFSLTANRPIVNILLKLHNDE